MVNRILEPFLLLVLLLWHRPALLAYYHQGLAQNECEESVPTASQQQVLQFKALGNKDSE